MITLTENAAKKVLEIAAEEGFENKPLRARIMGGGCAGFQHDLQFADEVFPMDEEFEHYGVTIVVDPLSYQYLDGTTIDFVDAEFASGFKFQNPNISGQCGCGSSVEF